MQCYVEEENIVRILYIAVDLQRGPCFSVALFLVENVKSYWIAIRRSRWTHPSPTFTGNGNVGMGNRHVTFVDNYAYLISSPII